MTLTKSGVLKLLSGLPWVGPRYQQELERNLLMRLESIEARFSSSSARFADLLHDLYDCLKELEGPLHVDVSRCHNLYVVTHLKTSGDARRLLERIKIGAFINPDEYFVGGQRKPFLDWYSNAASFEEFVDGMTYLLAVYCSNTPRPGREDGLANVKPIECNEITTHFMAGRWFKVAILDLIQTLGAVLTQRTGG